MTAIYYPYVAASIGASSRFEAGNAAEVVEKIISSNGMREKLGLNGTAGYYLHGLKLEKAQRSETGLERKLLIQWQAMQTVPQARAGEQNPIQTKTVYLQRGADDEPESAWEWVKDEQGKLHAQVL